MSGSSSWIGTSAAERGERFAALMTRAAARLPFVAPTVLGFALINGFTFAVDLALLTLLRTGLHVALWAAFTIAYLSAFALSFTLNRAFNFRSHAPVGRQLAIYLAAISVNYVVFIAGVADGLAAVGLEYHAARVLAAVGEGVYMYSVLRWVVFRRPADTLAEAQY